MTPTHDYQGVACELISSDQFLSLVIIPCNCYWEEFRTEQKVVCTIDLVKLNCATEGYEVEKLLNGFWGFRKSGDKYRPFQGRYKTREEALREANAHKERNIG